MAATAKVTELDGRRMLMLSAAHFCQHYLTNEGIGVNSVDPDQTAPIGAVSSGSTLFVKKPSKTF